MEAIRDDKRSDVELKALPYIHDAGAKVNVKAVAITGIEATKIDQEELQACVNMQREFFGGLLEAVIRIEDFLSDPETDLAGLYGNVLTDARNGKNSEVHDSIFANAEEAQRKQKELVYDLPELMMLACQMYNKASQIQADVTKGTSALRAAMRNSEAMRPASETAKRHL
jgi:hypothetical protein